MSGNGPPLPEHPELRRVAEGLERTGTGVEIYDDRWRIVFISTELARILGLDPGDLERFYGHSALTRSVRFAEEWATDVESGRRWAEQFLPIMRHDIAVGDPDFDDVFGPAAEIARRTEPVDPPPWVSIDYMRFPDVAGMRASWIGRVRFHYVRLYSADGGFLGTAAMSFGAMPDSLIARLARGDEEMFARMDRIREPERRSAAVLFADLEASGELSRRLSSRAYFELIRDLTNLIDDRVAAHSGVIGKHAGDGASALFLAEEAEGGESSAARAAIAAGCEIGERAGDLAGDAEVRLKVGLHWGAALTVGQVSTRGRLEVTALGDAMNEAARIEAAAGAGAVLASKELVERLAPADAEGLGIDPDELTYTTVADLATSDKQLRDAGSIAVVDLAAAR